MMTIFLLDIPDILITPFAPLSNLLAHFISFSIYSSVSDSSKKSTITIDESDYFPAFFILIEAVRPALQIVLQHFFLRA